MGVTTKKMTPVEIIRSVESLTPEDLETLLIMADKELAGELIIRREEAREELKQGKLMSKDEVFKDLD